MMQEPRLIEDEEWQEMPIVDKLKHYIATPPLSLSDPHDCRARGDFWSDLLGIRCGGYNSAVDARIKWVMAAMAIGDFRSANFKDCEEEVELIAYMLCSADIADYGTSPRIAFMYDEIRNLTPAVIERWNKDYQS